MTQEIVVWDGAPVSDLACFRGVNCSRRVGDRRSETALNTRASERGS